MEGASRLDFVGFSLLQSVSDLDRGAGDVGLTPEQRLLLYLWSLSSILRASDILELPRDVYSQLSVNTLWLSNQLISSSNSYRSTTTTSGYYVEYINFFFLWRCGPTRARASSFMRFLDHTRLTTVGRTPLDEWSARRRDLYLTTHNTYNRQISIPRRDSNPRSQQASGRRPTP